MGSLASHPGWERERDSHKGEDSNDGHGDEQLDGNDGIDLEQSRGI